MVTRGHFTAGDLSPVVYANETNYGVKVTPGQELGYIREGGNFLPLDNPHPHITWRAGKRTFSAANYVTQQNEAGFRATYEVADHSGALNNVFQYAHQGTFGDALMSKTVGIRERTTGTDTLLYAGCKVNRLTVSADEPGGVVAFEEEDLASYSTQGENFNVSLAYTDAAVQWVGGVILGDTHYYPQNFKLTINNNLGRVLGYDSARGSITKALLEGKEEITFEMGLWMEDINWLANSMYNGTAGGDIKITLGINAPKVLTLTGLTYICDGNNTGLIQDKQMQTVRFNAEAMTVTNPA